VRKGRPPTTSFAGGGNRRFTRQKDIEGPQTSSSAGLGGGAVPEEHGRLLAEVTAGMAVAEHGVDHGWTRWLAQPSSFPIIPEAHGKFKTKRREFPRPAGAHHHHWRGSGGAMLTTRRLVSRRSTARGQGEPGRERWRAARARRRSACRPVCSWRLRR